MQKVWVYYTLLDIMPLYLSFIKGRRYLRGIIELRKEEPQV
jgi:hypothetical protein